MLNAIGFDTRVAASGPEALAMIESGPEMHALVSDFLMPGMDGIQIIKKAREFRPDLLCFLLTGYIGERTALKSGDLFTLIRKPIRAHDLAAVIEASLARRRT